MQANTQRIIIFANGDLPDLDKARHLLRNDDYIICADGGTRHALALGIQPNLIIGDMDSADQEQLPAFQEAGVPMEIYSHDKNATDLELALDRAIELKPEHILILAALGGRLDHTLANIALLSDPRLQEPDVRLDDGIEEVFLCRDQAQIRGKPGDLISLIPWQGPVSGIQTMDLKWPLKDEPLFPEKTRGLSNEMLGEAASVSITSGLLLVIHRRS
ncbi:MAG TPA: thiamine diphosphokinase [Anaerolineales bacterium]|nr:thiamine diphosphokinase [Anaerolineales bacterium]